MRPTAWSHNVTERSAQLAGLNETHIAQERARAAAHAHGQDGWRLTLDQPTYLAVSHRTCSSTSCCASSTRPECARLGLRPQTLSWLGQRRR